MPHWHYMTMELQPEDQLIRPMVNPETDLTREAAYAAIQQLLDQLAAGTPELATQAATWRRGAKDDTAFYDRWIWSIFRCDQATCQDTIAAVLQEWAGILASAGLQVGVARPRESQQ